MGKEIGVTIRKKTYNIYAANEVVLMQQCLILGGGNKKCLNLGSTFKQRWVSYEAFVAADKLGINLRSENLLQEMTDKKDQIIKEYQNNAGDYTQMTGGVGQLNVLELEQIRSIIVTTGDLQVPYQVVSPVYFQVSNKGIFSSQLANLINLYSANLEALKSNNLLGKGKSDWGFLYGEWSVGQNNFDKAFYIAIEELKKRAFFLNANAIVSMRQDIDLDTTNIQSFYMQMYGTAVRLL